MGSGHGHAHLHGDPDGGGAGGGRVRFFERPTGLSRWFTGIAGVVLLATIVGLVALWPSGNVTSGLEGITTTFYDARIVRVAEVPCPGQPAVDDSPLLCAEIDAEVLEGPDAGLIVPLDLFDAASAALSEGEVIVLEFDERAAEGFQYRFSDRERSAVLVWLAVLFALAVVALGRWRGVAALVGLGASVAVLVVFTVPALVDGTDPLLVALVSASAIAFAAVYLTHGVTTMSTVALLGTLAALALTAVLATVFVGLAGITGLASEEAAFLQLGSVRVELQGLVLAGIVIGALGAIDDMTVTQSSAVWELRAAGRDRPMRELYRSGMRIGRDHVASTVNTLVLAYAGASLPLLLFFSLADRPVSVVANGELVATEIVRTLVGSIGLVASVPLTTALAAWAAHRSVSGPRPSPEPPEASGSPEPPQALGPFGAPGT
jgi:uncharacterized membrane protein